MSAQTIPQSSQTGGVPLVAPSHKTDQGGARAPHPYKVVVLSALIGFSLATVSTGVSRYFEKDHTQDNRISDVQRDMRAIVLTCESNAKSIQRLLDREPAVARFETITESNQKAILDLSSKMQSLSDSVSKLIGVIETSKSK